jgi:ATP-dependent helicase/nuclease subunit A
VSVADDLSLAGALRSPLFALEDETLFWLTTHNGSLNKALFASSLPDEITEDERAKVIHAGNVITLLRSAKDALLVAELLNYAIELTGYDAVLLTEFLGQRKLANLHKLLEQARTLDRLNPGDVSGFATQLTEFVTRAPKEPVAATSAAGDVIRIMTIHNAKGLEFPLVVVPDLNRKSPPTSRDPIMDVELGPLVPSLEKDATVGWNLYQLAEKHQEQDEKIRLLYVAYTRAADYLILSSSLKDPHKPESEWLKFLGQRFDLSNGDCLAELPAGYTTPQIRVITSEPTSTREPTARTRSADLEKLLAKTYELAKAGQGVVPPGVAPIKPQLQTRRRFSFSRLSGALMFEQPEFTPLVESETTQPADPLAFGTLVHTLLERVPQNAPDQIKQWCEFLAPPQLNNPATLEVAAALVEHFLSSDRAQALATARCVQRELEFLLPWQIPEEPQSGRYLHGYIDCLYQDQQGEWHLLDYKSNQVTAEGVPTAAKSYEMQMYVYALACERALGKRPIESVLCFLRPGEEYHFAWTAERTAQLDAELKQAITSLLQNT